MQTDIQIRREMLDTLAGFINDADGVGNHVIQFLNASDVVIAAIEFDFVELQTDSGSSAIYRFKFIDDTYILKGLAIEDAGPGGVTKFQIQAKYGTPPSNNWGITGTVGTLASSADIKFNSVQWVTGLYITITSLRFVLPNGG